MFNKIRTRLILLILGGAILSIILVSLITNITLFNEFDLYMRSEQKNRLHEIVYLAEQSYAFKGNWGVEAINNIAISPLINDFDIVIRDINNNIVLNHYMESTIVQMHNEMMRRMGPGMRGANHPNMINGNQRDENYIVENFDLTFNDMVIGTLSIGHVGPFLVSERELEFTKGINLSILYGALISIFVSFLLGMYSSKLFSDPIVRITEAAKKISKGDLSTKIEVGNNVKELNELSRTINNLSKSLREQELLRKRLTSDISHELRTPLSILQSHIEAISDGVWKATPEKMDICKNEVVRLIKLVEELKYLTDIEKHKLKLTIQKFSLSNDLKDIVNSYSHQFLDKGIELNIHINDEVVFSGDRDKIKQIVINILSNALKFTNKGGCVSVKLLDTNDQVLITIEDTGIGLDEKDIPFIFERFYRADQSRNRKTGGAGIGLAITKSLVEAHKGEMVVSSKKNQGTKIVVALPKAGIIQS